MGRSYLTMMALTLCTLIACFHCASIKEPNKLKQNNLLPNENYGFIDNELLDHNDYQMDKRANIDFGTYSRGARNGKLV